MLLTIHFGTPRQDGLWFQRFFDTLHVPVFGLVGLSVFLLTGMEKKYTLPGRFLRSAIVVGLLSLLSEVVQIPGPRDASFHDLVSDWLGAASFILVAAAFDRRVPGRKRRIASGVCGIFILAIALGPLLVVSAAYVQRNSQFPALATFRPLNLRVFVWPNHVTMVREPIPGRPGAILVKLDKGRWPGLILHDVSPDWSNYETLVIEAGVLAGPSLSLNVRVHDDIHEQGDQAYSDRFNESVLLDEATGAVRIPLAAIRSAPANREMDMRHIASFAIFGTKDDAGREFWISGVRLE